MFNFNVIITTPKGMLLNIFLFVVCKIMWSQFIHFKLISLLCQLIQVLMKLLLVFFRLSK